MFFAVAHILYGMPLGEKKETMAYSRYIFSNLRPNGIARIVEHVHKETFVLTERLEVYTHHNLSNFTPKEV